MWLFAASHYQSQLDDMIIEHLEEMDDEGDSWSMDYCLSLHARAYILGNKLLAASFKEDVFWSLYRFLLNYSYKSVSMPGLIDAVKVIYDGTSTDEGWEMRKLVAVYCVTRLDHGKQEQSAAQQPLSELIPVWTEEERNQLVMSGLEEFLVDVLGEVQFAKMPSYSKMRALIASEQA